MGGMIGLGEVELEHIRASVEGGGLWEVGQEQTKKCVGEVGLEHAKEWVMGGGARAD